MTQDELKLVLEALKWCHGGEPCGTAEAIAVIEKALANVATNDTSKEYVDEMQKQRHEQEPVALPCCGYADANAVKWNPHNQVVQCHNCGQVYTATPQPEQEPVKIVQYNCKCGRTMKFESVHGVVAPQRTWVGLTDDEIAQGWKESWVTEQAWQSAVWWAEDKLKEKNT